MYDETIDIINAREIDTPSDSELEGSPFKKMTNKFIPPEQLKSYDSDSELHNMVNADKIVTDTEKNTQVKQSKHSGRTQTVSKSLTNKKPIEKTKLPISTDNSDSESDFEEDGVKFPKSRIKNEIIYATDGVYDENKFQHLKLTPELDNVFQHIQRYTPQNVEIEYKLQPFIPEYIPAVGDIDACIKLVTPTFNLKGEEVNDDVLEFFDQLGLTTLDEPTSNQSDSALLHLQLRAISKTNSAKSKMIVKKLDNAERNSKAIERWIKDVSDLYMSKPASNFSYNVKMPDLDTLLEEWPETMESTLNNVGFPPHNINCSLIEYIDIICTLFDIPIVEDTLNSRIQALHMLFTLYTAVKTSQLFAERQKENVQNL